MLITVYRKEKFTSQIAVQESATQTQYSPFYGEDRTPSYAILNFDSGYSFTLEKVKCNMKIGIENIFDSYYSTFSDWNNIPRKGRNFFLNVNFSY
ncbi:MAG TPA: hypothetical protein DCM02_04735 [Flavobacterium sp.]|nr:hypothetical protein [Flavobacterium sp.]HAT81495.1 hypothetical protein [Flavobacterium sp.]